MIRSLSRATRLPIQLAHECAHVLAAAPWAEDWEIVVGPAESDVSMDTFVEWREDAPGWGIALAHLAPLLTGLLGMLVAGLLLASGRLPAPVTAWDLLVWSALAMAWTLYTLPSRRDLVGALEALKEGDDDG